VAKQANQVPQGVLQLLG